MFHNRWTEVRHDNTAIWLSYWNDPINPKNSKYMLLAASSMLKGQSDKGKYKKASMLKVTTPNFFLLKSVCLAML